MALWYNGYNSSKNSNPWEEFFYQPFGYTLEIVKKKALNYKYIDCLHGEKGPDYYHPYYNVAIRKYWNNFASQYIPIKDEIIQKANKFYKLLFKNSHNILGILIRGTDYIAKKPFGHAIQPTPEMVIKDIYIENKKNHYKWYFIATEDDLIRSIFIKEFGKKLKYIKSSININYDYNKKELLAFNPIIQGNLKYMKYYLINIIILSKCLDIITSKTGGALATFILSNGFRNKKIYELGFYK